MEKSSLDLFLMECEEIERAKEVFTGRFRKKLVEAMEEVFNDLPEDHPLTDFTKGDRLELLFLGLVQTQIGSNEREKLQGAYDFVSGCYASMGYKLLIPFSVTKIELLKGLREKYGLKPMDWEVKALERY